MDDAEKSVFNVLWLFFLRTHKKKTFQIYLMISIMIFICQEIRAQICQEYVWVYRFSEIVLHSCELRWNLNFIWLSQITKITACQSDNLMMSDFSGLLVSSPKAFLGIGVTMKSWEILCGFACLTNKISIGSRRQYFLKHGFYCSLWLSSIARVYTHNVVIQNIQLVLE